MREIMDLRMFRFNFQDFKKINKIFWFESVVSLINMYDMFGLIILM